jgi:4-hydroxy-3-methylbut-2-en-1-yl diphosphate reductase
MDVLLANPRGFCAGVDRAIIIVEEALKVFGAPVYVRHEVVHNRFVVNQLRESGAVFVEDVHEVPDQSVVIFSAHGVSKKVWEEVDDRDLQVFDATCPLVTKVHLEVIRHQRAGRECVLIGHQGHPEVEGTMGQYLKQADGGIYLVETPQDVEHLPVKNPSKLAYVTQTTLSVDDTQAIVKALQLRFPDILGPKKDDICYATQNRQDAVKTLTADCDLILVLGSTNSSNSNRLREIAEKRGVAARLIDDSSEMERDWFAHCQRVGVTAGASAPEILVSEVIAQLRQWGAESVTELNGKRENKVFPIPASLKQAIHAR